MTTLYWFALVVGAGLLLLSVVGDILGADVHHDVDAHAEGGSWHVLSMRNATYFLFAFGACGILLGWVWMGAHPVWRAVMAVVLGVLAALLNMMVFGWLRRTESGALAGDETWVGVVGEVVLPLSAGGTGKIEVRRGGREHELLARPFDREAAAPESWTRVLVVEMQGGTALVTPYTGALDDVEETLGIPPGRETDNA